MQATDREIALLQHQLGEKVSHEWYTLNSLAMNISIAPIFHSQCEQKLFQISLLCHRQSFWTQKQQTFVAGRLLFYFLLSELGNLFLSMRGLLNLLKFLVSKLHAMTYVCCTDSPGVWEGAGQGKSHCHTPPAPSLLPLPPPVPLTLSLSTSSLGLSLGLPARK